MFKKIILTLAIILCTSSVWASEGGNLPAGSALQKLQQGNDRFVESKMVHPNQTKVRMSELVKGQHPYAVILSCSDSRIPPEVVFDQGLGDIFVIRNAGNVLDEHVLGSIEYAVHHLGVNLVVVLGHESCGAVGAAMKGGEMSPAVGSLVKSIQPACTKCKKEKTYTYDCVVKTNAQLAAKEILKDKELSECIKIRGLKVVPAFYDLDTGKVEFLK